MADPEQLYSELGDKIERFFQTYYGEVVDELRMGSTTADSVVWVDWADIHQWNPDVGEDFLIAHDAFREVFEKVLDDLDGRSEDDKDQDIRVRVYNIDDDRTFTVGETRREQLEDFVAIKGQIAKVTDSRLKFHTAMFRCKRCGGESEIPQSEHGFQEPHQCQHCERQGPFKLLPERSDTTDHRLVQLQEPPEDADGDASTFTAVVTGDLEEWLSERNLGAGARVTVNGVLELNYESESNNWGTFDTYLKAESIEIEEQDYEEIAVEEYVDEIRELAADPDIYERLVDSLAPEITGGDRIRMVKLAIMLQLFGGYRRKKPDGSWLRGDSHILLLGDPATGKSSLMDAVEEIAPRVSRSSGKGSTAAGLTASAVRDNEFGDGQFTLEAGALALADKGVACVDEIDKMREDSLESIHSALEQQRVHVNKAGINATIPTRTALLAAGNPTYGRFDDYEPEYEQHDLDPALFSRFDLPFALKDKPDPDRDGMIAEQKTAMWQETAELDRGEISIDEAEASSPEIPQETLRAYIAYARQNLKPVLTDDAAAAIEDYYTSIRSSEWSDNDDRVPITPRVMDALRRLAEAAARVRLSEEATVEDVERVKKIVATSLSDFGMNEEGEFDADMVETGHSAPQRQKIKGFQNLAESLAEDVGGGVPRNDLLDAAKEELGISRDDAVHYLDKMKERSEAYDHPTGGIGVKT